MERVNRHLVAYFLCLIGVFLIWSCDNPVDMKAAVEDQVMVSNQRYLELSSWDIPVDSSGLFNPTGTIELTFDREIDLETVSPQSLIVADAAGNVINYPSKGVTWVPGAKTLRLRIYPYLPVNTDFTITVTDDIRGIDGSKIRKPVNKAFKTKNILSGSVNSVTGTDPISLPGYTVTSQVNLQMQVSDFYLYFKYRVSADGGSTWSNYFPNGNYVLRSSLTDGAYNVTGFDLDELGSIEEGPLELTIQFSGNDTGSGEPIEGLIDTAYITFDGTAPQSGTIKVNSDGTYTKTADVTLTFTQPTTDALSGVDSFRVSNNETSWSSWLPLETSLSWNLITGAGGVSNQGTRNVFVQTRDKAGNISSSTQDSIIYDATAPSSGTWVINSGGTYATSPSVTFNVTDEPSETLTGLSKISFSNNATNWSPWEVYNPAFSKTWNLSTGEGGSSSQGTRTVYVRIMDGAGNVSSNGSDSIVFDNSGPAPGIWYINSNASATNVSTVTMAASKAPADSYSGVVQMSLSNNGSTWSAWEAYTTSKSWDCTNSTYGGSTAEGTKYVYIRFKDGAGNISSSASDSITRDVTNPSAGVIRLNSGNTYSNSSTVTIGYTTTPSDARTSIAGVRYSNNGTSWTNWVTYTSTYSWNITNTTYGGTSTEGTRYVYLQVQDAAGNISPTVSDAIVYDITPPSGYLYAGGSGNPSEITSPYTTIYFYVTDNLSGIAQRKNYNYSTSSYMTGESYTSTKTWIFIPGNGSKTFYAQFTDGAGNVASIYDSVTLNSTYSSLSRTAIALNRDTLSGDSNAYMSSSSISMNDGSSNLNPGRIYVYYTSGGRYGKMEIVSFTKTEVITVIPPLSYYNTLKINYVTYNSDGSVYKTGSSLRIRGTYSCDLDTGTETSSGADFWWSINSDTIRSLVPQGVARFYRWN